MGDQKANEASHLFSYIGDGIDLKEFSNADTSKEIEYLVKIEENLKKAGCGSNLHIDLSEVGSQSYHTGIVFQVYMPSMDSAVISGGRYDGLLGNFGIDAPSVGFSLLQRKLEPKIGNRERFTLPAKSEKIMENDILIAFERAEKLRKEGKIAAL